MPSIDSNTSDHFLSTEKKNKNALIRVESQMLRLPSKLYRGKLENAKKNDCIKRAVSNRASIIPIWPNW